MQGVRHGPCLVKHNLPSPLRLACKCPALLSGVGSGRSCAAPCCSCSCSSCNCGARGRRMGQAARRRLPLSSKWRGKNGSFRHCGGVGWPGMLRRGPRPHLTAVLSVMVPRWALRACAHAAHAALAALANPTAVRAAGANSTTTRRDLRLAQASTLAGAHSYGMCTRDVARACAGCIQPACLPQPPSPLFSRQPPSPSPQSPLFGRSCRLQGYCCCNSTFLLPAALHTDNHTQPTWR